MIPIFNAFVKKGKVIFDHHEQWAGYLFTLEGRYVHVTIKKRQKKRSNPQNAFYWGVVIHLLCETTGYGDNEMHFALKMMFLLDRSRKIPTVKSTAVLTTVEFEEYLEKIRVWSAQELNCIIPLPNEVSIDDSETIKEPIPVSEKTLSEIFGWVGKGGITKKRIIEISKFNFQGREPKELMQEEAEKLDTLIVSEMPLK